MYPSDDIGNTLRRRPDAVAMIRGSADYARIRGTVLFYRMRAAVLVRAELFGLRAPTGTCDSPIFGFHIHNGAACAGDASDPFAQANGHYNPHDCPHPYHVGDLPPLFGVGGRAFSVFLTNRFTVSEIIGKTLIIHNRPDDFTTQPSGNAGDKIACGIIRQAR